MLDLGTEGEAGLQRTGPRMTEGQQGVPRGTVGLVGCRLAGCSHSLVMMTPQGSRLLSVRAWCCGGTIIPDCVTAWPPGGLCLRACGMPEK